MDIPTIRERLQAAADSVAAPDETAEVYVGPGEFYFEVRAEWVRSDGIRKQASARGHTDFGRLLNDGLAIILAHKN
jgi:hypothetical protein